MQPKVNYAASNGILSAVKGASLSWATAEEEKKPTTDEQAGDETEPETPGEGGGDGEGHGELE